MKYCALCGKHVEFKIPQGDNRPRFICNSCGEIHYQNPKNVVGTIPILGEKILLCRRAIEPRKGLWTLPAGFLELDETTAEGAQRETIEEAGAQIAIGPLFSILNVAHIGQVHWFYLAQMTSPVFSPVTSESLEVALFDEASIPWDEIAFLTVRTTLQWFFADRQSGKISFSESIPTHQIDLKPIVRVNE
jgi:ADP-ribose pyrophosphatase YjhB (NUDIX family)